MRNLKLKNIIAMAMICIMSTAIYGCEKSNISNNKNNTEVEETNKKVSSLSMFSEYHV